MAGPCDHRARDAVENADVAKANDSAATAAPGAEPSSHRAMRYSNPAVRAIRTLAVVFSTSPGGKCARRSASRLWPLNEPPTASTAMIGATTTAVPQGKVYTR